MVYTATLALSSVVRCICSIRIVNDAFFFLQTPARVKVLLGLHSVLPVMYERGRSQGGERVGDTASQLADFGGLTRRLRSEGADVNWRCAIGSD
jgi:hypothetical protein